MEDSSEVIVASSKHCRLYDADNGNILKQYKPDKIGHIAPKTLAIIGEDYLIGAHKESSFVQAWTIGKSSEDQRKFPVPGIATCLAVSSCGTFCIVAFKESFVAWKMTTGDLLGKVSRHYQDITTLRFSSDDSHILSGGKDGYVFVWLLSEVIDVNNVSSQVKPRFAWKHHSAEITDIYPGVLGSYARVATTSSDTTCKVYELNSGILLATIITDTQLTSVVMDPCEYFIVMGGENGCIYKVITYDALPSEVHLNNSNHSKVKAHDERITCLSISSETGRVLSASDDKTLKVWDMLTVNPLLIIRLDGEVKNAFFANKPKILFNDRLQPAFFLKKFKLASEVGPSRGYEEVFTPHHSAKPSSLIYVGAIDNYYNSELLNGSIHPRRTENGAVSQYEDLFKATLNAKSVNELRAINSQIYSYAIKSGLDGISRFCTD